MRLLLLLGLLLVVSSVSAQDADSLARWQRSLVGTVNASQAAYSNWTQGGLNTIAGTAALDGKAERETPMWQQTHKARFAFGLVKQDTLAVRKADDVIRLETTLRYRGDGFFHRFQPTAAVSFRSQFTSGYDYGKNPFGDGRKPPVEVSDFFAPATFNQALGLTYQPSRSLKQRVGIGSKQTIVARPSLRPLYNMGRDRLARVEAGLEARTEVDVALMENVRYTSSLGLFAAFNKPETPDVTWDNEVVMKVNRWLTTNLQASLLFDRDQSPRPQIKEVFSIGLSFVLI